MFEVSATCVECLTSGLICFRSNVKVILLIFCSECQLFSLIFAYHEFDTAWMRVFVTLKLKLFVRFGRTRLSEISIVSGALLIVSLKTY